MFNKKSKIFLEKLLKTTSPSGFEMEVAHIYKDYLSTFCEETYHDVMGNTIGVINKNAEFKVILAGHYDEIGYQIVYISEEGFLYFRNVGGVDKLTLPGTEVEIITDSGKIPGIIGKKPIHLVPAKDRSAVLETKDLWIDIGARNKKEAEKLVTIGDPATPKVNIMHYGKNRIMSKGLDDKIGAFTVAEATRLLSKEKKFDIGVYCVGTVQEELGYRGVETAAYTINPNVGIAVDVTFATDVPDINKKEFGNIELGKGPTLTRFANENLVLGKHLRKTAKNHKIPYQEEAGISSSGGTDTCRIQLTRNGVATSLISIPNRYMHTPVEICDLEDVNNSILLIKESILSLKKNTSFTF